MSGHLTYPEALVIGALQGVTELFPVSSLGHSVLIPALLGGRWAQDLNVSAPESPYLAFIVGLHVATALALLVFFWRDWLRILTGLVTSARRRRIDTPDERLGWMIVIATIPVGLGGLLLEHAFRTILGRPVPAAFFLMVNGLILLWAERLRQRQALREEPTLISRQGGRAVFASQAARTALAAEQQSVHGAGHDTRSDDIASDRRIAAHSMIDTTVIGSAQILALAAGISRSGVTMAAGLAKGLSHEDAARFAFLLATPVIFAAGLLKLPDLFGPLGAGIHGQALVGSLAAGVAAYLSVRYLTTYFKTRTLKPFAVYCLAAGLVSLAWLALG